MEAGFEAWKRAYGTLSWDDYLEMVVRNPETGAWAAQAAKLMLQGRRRAESGVGGAVSKS